MATIHMAKVVEGSMQFLSGFSPSIATCGVKKILQLFEANCKEHPHVIITQKLPAGSRVHGIYQFKSARAEVQIDLGYKVSADHLRIQATSMADALELYFGIMRNKVRPDVEFAFSESLLTEGSQIPCSKHTEFQFCPGLAELAEFEEKAK